jgi:glycerophosphoryl diester phosphodiesterase
MGKPQLGATMVVLLAGCAATGTGVDKDMVYFQAHRGGLDEVPENTLAGFRYAWGIPGAVPEVDVRTTRDGVMVCIHDGTLARTTNAPEKVSHTPMSDLTFDEVRCWDAGIRFDMAYKGEKVPALTELLDLMVGSPGRELYLEVKEANLDALQDVLEPYGIVDRLIFVHGDQAMCGALQRRFGGARTMTWLSGDPPRIQERFGEVASSGFAGLTQLQLHLPSVRTDPEIAYALENAFLDEALAVTRAVGIDLQLRPFEFSPASLGRLLDLGIRWFAADRPQAFVAAIEAAQAGSG